MCNMSRSRVNTFATACIIDLCVLQVGCGADELIDLLLRCVLDPGDAIVDCQPTFGMYAFDTDVSGGRVITIPRKSDFSLDMEAIVAAVKEQKPKVVFLTSPNNPDGSMLLEDHLLQLLAQPVRHCTLQGPAPFPLYDSILVLLQRRLQSSFEYV